MGTNEREYGSCAGRSFGKVRHHRLGGNRFRAYLPRPAQCLEFAVGSIAVVLGPDFAAVDRYPTRVRLPDEPLMLVDRIVSIEGNPRSLKSGRVVTEHVIEPGAWYLDGGRIAPCIAIEAGQADLFLCALSGGRLRDQGAGRLPAAGRDCDVSPRLPAAGEVIRYDIRISDFFRQGKTILFRFQFDATVAGEPLLTMRDGCAGFFTPEELAAGQGNRPAAPSICRDKIATQPRSRLAN